MEEMRYRNLGSTGLRVSELGFGAATLGDEYGKADPAEMERARSLCHRQRNQFLRRGALLRQNIGRNPVRRALRKAVVTKSIIATKCARYDIDGFDFSAAGVRRSIDESLKRLQTDYVDILHIHDVEFGCRLKLSKKRFRHCGAYKARERLVSSASRDWHCAC